MFMTVSTICIFCFIVAGHVIEKLYCLTSLVVVMCVCIFHYSDGTKLIPM
jgi:hypothetical protein